MSWPGHIYLGPMCKPLPDKYVPATSKQFFIIFGRTDLRISLSGAKFDAEADFDVRSAVAPTKPHQIEEKMAFRFHNVANCFLFWRRRKTLQII